MAISEELCWEVLRSAQGEIVKRSWLKGSETDDPDLKNAIPLAQLEYDLVLHYSRDQIEDSLYFLLKRGYLIQHGHRELTRVAYQLTDRANEALKLNQFTEDEQTAFKEAVLDLKKPGWLGMRVNLGEAWRRAKKRLRPK